jgi:hypothetical protein
LAPLILPFFNDALSSIAQDITKTSEETEKFYGYLQKDGSRTQENLETVPNWCVDVNRIAFGIASGVVGKSRL